MPTLTLAQLQDRVWSMLDYNTLLYPSSELTDAINECAKVLNVLTAFYQNSVDVAYPTQKNRIWYDVPSGIVIPTKVKYEGKYLKPSSLRQIGRARARWVTETTCNQVQPVTSWIKFGLYKFAIWPADAIGGNTITVTGVADVPLLVNPTDTINLNNDCLSAFDLLAAHVLQLKESPRMFAQASVQYQAFTKIVKSMNEDSGYKAPAYFVAELSQPQRR